ncbi:hypothetical protein D0W74_23895 [Escherichia coli]|uniref:Uncharacterized protein n=1 Tax=Salmonella typhimurium TaxID=90371 RepID=A0A706ANM0_SALTM|nr:hypothetical protein BVL38_26705 [Escherichia coli]EAO9766752.1 hypothetical protein [Salmonella enterica]EBH3510765.1 hypothetical protein [Salmonella enterica subsp. enterica serovar Rissen]EBX3672352.1 hypothetical protein [Salmonella enterica subsp. enterica serovar Stanley]ECA0619432.1 hypothetical protein [Salmonella enterica subsp. enterica serovar Brandenburg]EDW9038736.1 hypothetical protein [Salmonella enterica subsp. enterica serovar 4,[5],12:i:-]HAC9096646.1 hypothetical protei
MISIILSLFEHFAVASLYQGRSHAASRTGRNNLNVHSGMASMNGRSVPEVGVTYPYPNITL